MKLDKLSKDGKNVKTDANFKIIFKMSGNGQIPKDMRERIGITCKAGF